MHGEDVVCLIKNSASLAGSLFTLHVSQIRIDLPTLTDNDKKVGLFSYKKSGTKIQMQNVTSKELFFVVEELVFALYTCECKKND